MITDTHTHLFHERFATDLDEVIARARATGVERMLVVGIDADSSARALELCAHEPGLFPSAGIHPHDALPAATAPEQQARIQSMCRRPECVAVGETGLDFFKNYAPREAQLENFAWHIALARALGKPLVVHCRDAHVDTLRLLREGAGPGGVMHCYSLSSAELPDYLELGFYISFSGIVTYPRNGALREAAAAVPADRLLVETDCPYLAPQEQRGKRNEPALVRSVLVELAKLRGTGVAELERITSTNAARLFHL